MLGYRTFVNVAGDRDRILDLVDQQIYSWTREKRWDGDSLVDGETVRLSDDAEGTLVRLSTQDGSRTTRLLTVENRGWKVRLTAHVPGARDRQPWIWLDVESPESGARPQPPRIVRNLFDVLDVRDGEQSIPPAVVRAGEEDVDALVARVLDPGRRTIAFVAGSTDDIPLAPWSDHVAKLTRQCSGIASTTVLDPAGTRAFAEAIGPQLAVAAWTVRTFMPRVDADDPNDAVRHRYLTMQRIIDDPASRIAGMLGARAAAVVRDLPLPREALRIDRALSKHLDDAVVGKITQVRPEVRAAITEAASKADEVPAAADESEATPVGRTQPLPAGVEAVLTAATSALLGSETLDADSVNALIDLAAAGRQAAAQQAAVRARMDQLQAQLDDLTLRVVESEEALMEERLEHQVTDLDRARAEDMVRRLRRRLDVEGTDSWVGPPATDDELAPQDFTELVSRLETLTAVVFTGDHEVVIGLDTHQSGRWAVKAWEALSAVEDYALAKNDGRCDHDLEGYLRDTPEGCRGFSVNRFGRDESGEVKTNPKFRRPRELPVPDDVDESGVIFMGAHFKLAQSGLISPRIHCHDDTSRTGKVYDGYIGPHLPTNSTN